MLIRPAFANAIKHATVTEAAANIKPAAPKLTIRTTKDFSAKQVERRVLSPAMKHHRPRAENNSAPLSAELFTSEFSASTSPTSSISSSTGSTPTESKTTTPIAKGVHLTLENFDAEGQELQYETYDIEADKLTLKPIPDEMQVEVADPVIFDISDQLKQNDNVDINADKLIVAPNPADAEKEARLLAANQRKIQYDFEVCSVTVIEEPLEASNIEAPYNVLKEPIGQTGILIKKPLEKFTAVTVTPLIEYSILVDVNPKRLAAEKVRAALEQAAKSPALQHQQAFKDLKRLQDRVRVLTYTTSPLTANKKQQAENELNAQLVVCEALLKKAEKLQKPIRALTM